MRRLLPLLLLLGLPGIIDAQTPTPYVATDVLAVVDCAGTEAKFSTDRANPEIEITNIGGARATIKLSATISETTPATPTATQAEFILVTGGTLRLPRGRGDFWFICAAQSALSVVVR